MNSTPPGVCWALPWPARLAYSVAIAAGLWVVAPKAWYALRNLRPDMNLLMTIAVAGAVALGEWFEAATVAWLFSLSLALEAWSVGRARRAVAALMKLAPDRVRLVREDGEVNVDPAEVAPGQASVSASTGASRVAPLRWIRRRSRASRCRCQSRSVTRSLQARSTAQA